MKIEGKNELVIKSIDQILGMIWCKIYWTDVLVLKKVRKQKRMNLFTFILYLFYVDKFCC